MPKEGIKFDYDLWANHEIKNGNICRICRNPLRCRWTDYSGEGVCLKCGAPYQLKWGSQEQEKEKEYPYLKVKDIWIPILKQYWKETNRFCFNGTSFSERTGVQEFGDWLETKYKVGL